MKHFSYLCIWLFIAPVFAQPSAQEILHNMTIQEKIAQLFIVATTISFEQPEEGLKKALAGTSK